MPNLEVNLTKLIQTAMGPRYCPVVLSANGRVKPDFVLVGGNSEKHIEGSYYLEWRNGSKRIRRSVGKDAADGVHPEQILGNAQRNSMAKTSVN